MNEQQVNEIIDKVQDPLIGLDVSQALPILLGVIGECLSSLPKPLIRPTKDQLVEMLESITDMAESVSESPTLN